METNLRIVSEDLRVKLREELTRRQAKNSAYSLRAFARYLEISPSYLCEILHGKKNPTPQKVERLTSRLMAAEPAILRVISTDTETIG